MDYHGHNNVAVVPEIRLDMSELDEIDVCTEKVPTRVFFEQGQNGQLETTYEPTNPVSIKSSNESKDFQVSVDTCAVHPGWYWAVFCVSLREIDDSKLKNVIFDVTSENMCLGIVYIKDYTCKTAIQRDEIDLLPRTRFVRLRLHRQIEVSPDTALPVSIKVEKASECEEVVVPFDLHYFELAYRDIRSEDHILWGEGKPDQFIRMGDGAASGTRPIAIEAYDFSPTGKLAVTVYFSPADNNVDHGPNHAHEHGSTYGPDHASMYGFDHDLELDIRRYYNQGHSRSPTPGHAHTPSPTHDHSQTPENLYNLDQDHSHISSSIYTLKVAHVDVWDLRSGVSDNPQAITTPLKRLSFPVRMLKRPPGDFCENKSPGDYRLPDDPPEPPLPTINISSTGLHVIMAVGWETKQVHATPFLIYRAEQNPPVAYDYKRVPKTCQSIQNFYGYGAFHHTDKVDPKAENEHYFNFHGSKFDVYSTNGAWKQLYSLSFGINGVLRRPEDMFYLYQSLRGRYFAWTGDKGAVSIWDFGTGKFVTTIVIPEDTRGVCAALSEDGSMVAITVNGRIQVHDVASGIKLGFREAQWKEDNGSEIIFKHDYFMALDAEQSTSGKKNIDTRSIFRVRDMKIVKTHFVSWEYRAEFSSTVDPMFSYQQGAILNIKRLGNILCPTEDNGCAPDIRCEFRSTELDLKDNTWRNRNQSCTETKFLAGPAQSSARRSGIRLSSFMELIITNHSSSTSLALGPEEYRSFGFFMATSSQLVLILSGILQVWYIPSEADQYELVHVEAFVAVSKGHANDICITRVSTVKSCEHGRKFNIAIHPIQWLPDPKKKEMEDGSEKEEAKLDFNEDFDEGEYYDSDQPQTLTFPRTVEDTFLASEKYRYEKGVASLLDTYADSSTNIKDAIIRFLVERIRPSSKYSSSLVILCGSWKHSNRLMFENIITDLLPATCVTWIPDINATKREDPLSILTETAKKTPSVLGACKIIINYCVNHAIESKNTSFLSPFLRNLSDIVVLFPDEALIYLGKIAYIRVNDSWRDYVVEHSIVSHPPWHYNHFRKSPLSLNKIKRPVMQLHVTTEGSRFKADTFNRPIYVAAFDALWHFEDNSECERENERGGSVKLMSMVKPWATSMLRSAVLTVIIGLTARQESRLESVAPTQGVPMAPTQEVPVASPDSLMHQGAAIPQETTWWKTFYHMFRHKCNLRTHTYVTCHAFSLEFFDNPAIAALVEYKWNTIGYAYWAFRFFFQCVFYVLVFVAALLQVYHENVGRAQLVAVFVAIIVVGVVYLWLELWQAVKNFWRYSRTLYNLLDIVAYLLPIAASINMLVALSNNSAVANTRILSYSVLAVFLHMLFELRVHKSMCKYVTFIRESIVEMRVFFFIFAGGIMAFAISTLHLLRACSIPGSCEDPTTKFPTNIFGALSATYFFMSGRLDPVSEELGLEDWAFHLMMAIYFFFTVIVMLNVLIALINVAFMKSDASWRLIESRLHYIELAENLSYHIPGFRQTHNWFPKEIYFYATAQEVEEYEKKVKASEGEAKDSTKSDAAVEALQTQVQNLESKLISQQDHMELQFKKLEGLLLDIAKSSNTPVRSNTL